MGIWAESANLRHVGVWKKEPGRALGGEAMPGTLGLSLALPRFLPAPTTALHASAASPHFTGGKLRSREGKDFSEFCMDQGQGKDKRVSLVPLVQGPSAQIAIGPLPWTPFYPDVAPTRVTPAPVMGPPAVSLLHICREK